MGKRGRKSAASLRATPPPVEIVERIKPPHDLHDDEVEIWSAMVSERPADWFSASSAPLLAQLCRHVIHAHRVAELIERAIAELSVDDYDRLLRMQERETRGDCLALDEAEVDAPGHEKSPREPRVRANGAPAVDDLNTSLEVTAPPRREDQRRKRERCRHNIAAYSRRGLVLLSRAG